MTIGELRELLDELEEDHGSETTLMFLDSSKSLDDAEVMIVDGIYVTAEQEDEPAPVIIHWH